MKIHYFQRYHRGEDVANANTMLLLSRLYLHSPNLFFQFMKEQFFGDVAFDPELVFALQERGIASVPDAIISQPSFKLVIETKKTDWFYQDQLIRHLSSFKNEEYKVLITLSSKLMQQKKKVNLDKVIADFNAEHRTTIIHINTTFEHLAQGVQDVLSDHDYAMQDVLDDYWEYCYHDGLIVVSDAWRRMRMQLAGTTFDYNVRENLYYDNIDRGFSQHSYLALYKQKSIRAIGKISAIITAVLEDGVLRYDVEQGELAEERKEKIDKARKDGTNYGYSLDATRYFFVDKFYETDFAKASKGAARGTHYFDLTKELQVDSLPETEIIAKMLKETSWT